MWGSLRLRKLVESSQPQYHFFAHHKERIKPTTIGNTKCYWLNDVNFDMEQKKRAFALEEGCMGILFWEDEFNHNFEIVNEAWTKGVNSENWWEL